MRNKKISLLIFGLCSLSPICLAESNQQSTQQPKTSISLTKKNKSNSSRPKAPDRQVVTCEYDGENLHLSFVYPEGSATLSVTDDSLLTATYLIDTDPLDLKVSVGSLSGTISVKIETEYGNTFVGDLP